MTDNRRAPRVMTPHVMVKVSTREKLKTSYLKDLSEGGVFLRTDKPLPIGREVSIDLLPPEWPAPIRLNGNVVRVEAGGMAVVFARNDEHTLGRIKSLVTEYLNAPEARPARSEADDAQLRDLLEKYAELQNAFEHKDAQLVAERARREEAVSRAIALEAQLEVATGVSGAQASSDAQQLHAELSVLQNEAAELRTRIAEVEGERDAFKTEFQQLEADDASSRKLAATLAREKTELAAEVAKLTKAATESEARKAEAQRAKEEKDKLVAALKTAEQSNEARGEELVRVKARADELALNAHQLTERNARAEAELIALRGSVNTLERKATQLEASLKDVTTRHDRLKTKERELRELLDMVSAKSTVSADGTEDVVTVSDSSPSMILAAASLEGVATPIAIEDEGAPEPVKLEVVAASLPEMPAMSTGSAELAVSIELDVDAPDTAAPRSEPLNDQREAIERRIRANEPLKKAMHFDTFAPDDSVLCDVRGLLEAGSRLSELMVLGRGRVTPPQLTAALVSLVSAGAVAFEAG